MGLLDRLCGKKEQPAVTVSAELTKFERVPVVGESHYQDALLAICGASRGESVSFECIAELVPEPENPVDPNAIMVRIDGRHVGYLSRENAVMYGPRVSAMVEAGQPTICDAFIGCAPETGNPNLGVSLHFPVSR